MKVNIKWYLIVSATAHLSYLFVWFPQKSRKTNEKMRNERKKWLFGLLRRRIIEKLNVRCIEMYTSRTEQNLVRTMNPMVDKHNRWKKKNIISKWLHYYLLLNSNSIHTHTTTHKIGRNFLLIFLYIEIISFHLVFVFLCVYFIWFPISSGALNNQTSYTERWQTKTKRKEKKCKLQTNIVQTQMTTDSMQWSMILSSLSLLRIHKSKNDWTNRKIHTYEHRTFVEINCWYNIECIVQFRHGREKHHYTNTLIGIT